MVLFHSSTFLDFASSFLFSLFFPWPSASFTIISLQSFPLSLRFIYVWLVCHLSIRDPLTLSLSWHPSFSVKLFFNSPPLFCFFYIHNKSLLWRLDANPKGVGDGGREMKEEQRTNATCRVMAVGQKVSILICSPVEGWWKKDEKCGGRVLNRGRAQRKWIDLTSERCFCGAFVLFFVGTPEEW